MKKLFILISLFCALGISSFAQDIKFGKPTNEEWELNSVSFAPEAEAVVLYKSVDLSYKLSGGFSALGSGGEGSLDDNSFAPSGTNKYINPDGVTSMLYYSHGLGEAFCGYPDYFNGHQDDNAICYLTLANLLIHEVNPNAITIAEEVSGMPGLAAKYEDGGYGFDYRMAMNIPDYWIKTIKEVKDEDWKPSSIFWEVKNCRPLDKPL